MQCHLVPERCIACGLCQIYAPAVFDYNDDGIVLFKTEPEALKQFVTSEQIENVLKSYRKCPVRAIEISEKSV
jgi:ferredoxin